MDAAARNKNVAAVWLRLDGFEPEGGTSTGPRRHRGGCARPVKPVYAEMHSADRPGTRSALACEKNLYARGRTWNHRSRMVRTHFKGPAGQGWVCSPTCWHGPLQRGPTTIHPRTDEARRFAENTSRWSTTPTTARVDTIAAGAVWRRPRCGS